MALKPLTLSIEKFLRPCLLGCTPVSAGSLAAGGLESSNVDIATELTSLIQRQRAYSSNAKIITTADDMLDETIRLKR